MEIHLWPFFFFSLVFLNVSPITVCVSVFTLSFIFLSNSPPLSPFTASLPLVFSHPLFLHLFALPQIGSKIGPMSFDCSPHFTRFSTPSTPLFLTLSSPPSPSFLVSLCSPFPPPPALSFPHSSLPSHPPILTLLLSFFLSLPPFFTSPSSSPSCHFKL